MKKILLILTFLMILCPDLVFAWDSYDYDTGNYIEIDNQDSVIQGNDIEINDYNDECYHDVYVIFLNHNGVVIIEVFDYNTGDYRTFEMMEEAKIQENI